MKRADAPAPGWYPDPRGGTRLRWWDGLDWGDHWRVPPPFHRHDADPTAVTADRTDGFEPGGRVGTVRSRADGPVPGSEAMSRQEREELMAEVRRSARQEVERATATLTDSARQATSSIEATIRNLADDYLPTIGKWIKRGVVIVVVLGLILFLLQAVGSVAQVRLLEWIGDRIDALFSVVDAGALLAADASLLDGSAWIS